MNHETQCCDPEQGARLAAYELGVLPAAERASFEQHLKGCENCQEQLYSMAPAVAALLLRPGEAAARLAATEATPAGAEEPTPAGEVAPTTAATWATTVRRQLRALLDKLRLPADSWQVWVPVAAAAALMLVVLDHPLDSERPTFRDLARLAPAPYVQTDLRGGSAIPATGLFRQGMQLYQEGSYAEAAVRLRAGAREAIRRLGTEQDAAALKS